MHPTAEVEGGQHRAAAWLLGAWRKAAAAAAAVSICAGRRNLHRLKEGKQRRHGVHTAGAVGNANAGGARGRRQLCGGEEPAIQRPRRPVERRLQVLHAQRSKPLLCVAHLLSAPALHSHAVPTRQAWWNIQLRCAARDPYKVQDRQAP